MKSSKFFALGLALAFFAGCQHLPENKAMNGSGWTQDLRTAGISGSLDDLARPRDYSIGQAIGDGSGAVSGENGTVLADLTGPGCVVRFYAADPQGDVQIYIDGSETPQYNGPFSNLFMSTFPSFGEPLTDVAGGASYTYVPIPYASSCKIVHTGDQPASAYQVTYATFDETKELQSFMIDTLDGGDKGYFANWSDEWEDGMDYRYSDRDTEKVYHTRKSLYPHENDLIWTTWEPGTVTEIEMTVGSFSDDILRNLWLAVFWDGEDDPSVLTPLGALCGSVLNADGDFGGPAVGQKDGRLWIRFPMPFGERAEFRLINGTDTKIDLAYWITYVPGAPSLKRYFHARYNEGLTMPGKPYTVAEVSGRGHYVGCAIATEGGASHFNLAGGEEIRIDGAMKPTIAGTTTGAYFNSAWDFAGEPFTRPSHGLSASGNLPGAYHASAYRVHYADAISFDEKFAFTLNHGPNNTEAGLRYASVAFWYLDRPARDGSLWTVPGLAMEDPSPTGTKWREDFARWGRY